MSCCLMVLTTNTSAALYLLPCWDYIRLCVKVPLPGDWKRQVCIQDSIIAVSQNEFKQQRSNSVIARTRYSNNGRLQNVDHGVIANTVIKYKAILQLGAHRYTWRVAVNNFHSYWHVIIWRRGLLIMSVADLWAPRLWLVLFLVCGTWINSTFHWGGIIRYIHIRLYKIDI